MKTEIKFKNLENTFVTSDPHLNHGLKAILDKRGVKTAEENTKWVIKKWNSVVKQDSDVYMLGDFCLHDPDGKVTRNAFKELNFKNLYILWGNHNSGVNMFYRKTLRQFFGGSENKANKYEVYPLKVSVGKNKNVIFVGDYLTGFIKETRVVMFHYAIRNWHHKESNSWMLTGHSHGNDKAITPQYGNMKILDCSIDSLGRPWSIQEIKTWMDIRTTKKTYDNRK